MNKNMTTLGRVSERVNNLSKDCHDNLVKVEDISFDSLETVKIANEPHLLRPLAQQSAACQPGNSHKLSEKVSPGNAGIQYELLDEEGEE